MRLVLVFTFLLLTGSIFTRAQSSSDFGPYLQFAEYPVTRLLRLTGTYRNCEPSERTQAVALCFKLKMALQSAAPNLIVINPRLSFGTGLRKVTFYFQTMAFDRETGKTHYSITESSVDIKPTVAEAESFKMMAPLMDSPLPAQNLTVTLGAGETLSFEDTLEVEPPVLYEDGGYRLEWDKATGRSVKKAQPKIAIHPRGFKLFYEYSFLQVISDPDYLEHLRQRWSYDGILPVNNDGTYSYSSKDISIR